MAVGSGRNCKPTAPPGGANLSCGQCPLHHRRNRQSCEVPAGLPGCPMRD